MFEAVLPRASIDLLELLFVFGVRDEELAIAVSQTVLPVAFIHVAVGIIVHTKAWKRKSTSE